jgi:hypothetical protein
MDMARMMIAARLAGGEHSSEQERSLVPSLSRIHGVLR